MEIQTKAKRRRKTHLYLGLGIASLLFVLPFWFMIVGAFQENPTNTPSAMFPTSGWTLENFVVTNDRIDLFQGLVNSLVFTMGVLAGTLSFGLLAGYAISRLEWRGRGALFVAVLAVQMVPFQLLMIPLYIQIAGSFGLSDTYFGMILPFFINTTAVFIFRQFFLGIPESLFEAARIDGAQELRILWTVAIPLVRPATATVVLITFIGPWNEFLWPFLITKDASMQPLAVSLANFIDYISQSVANPNGAILAGALVLAFPIVLIFCIFQKYFNSSDVGSGIKG